MTLFAGLRYPSQLAGLLALSAYMLLPDSLADEAAAANASTPLCAAHGKFDDIVPLFAGHAALDQIAAVDRQRDPSGAREMSWHEYPIGHEVSPPELAMIAGWLRQRLPPTA
jgi:phospholipase/carboxylesterase